MQAPRSLWLVVCLVGCEHTAVVGPQTVDHKMPEDPDLDVLFVIDNSASTADKQMLFAQNFVTLATKLDASAEGRPNLHIGVVSTTVGLGTDVNFGPSCGKTMPNDDGLLQNAPRVVGCQGPTGRFISDVADSSTRIVNYPGTLADAFSCIAQLGTAGCGFEAPLEAMKRALDGSRPENAGFLRPDADLAVIILTDEDDCSVADPSIFALNSATGPGDFRCQPLYAYDCAAPISATDPGDYIDCMPHHGGYLADPQSYVDFLKTIKPASQTFVGLIAGDPTSVVHTGEIATPFSQALALQPSCSATINGDPVIARPAIRLEEFLRAYPDDHGSFASACQMDYSAALGMFGDDMLTMMGPCFATNIDPTDNDATMPGVQPACAISEQHPNQPDAPDTSIPTCDMLSDGTPASSGPRPCWWAAPSAQCPVNGLQLHIERISPAMAGSVIDELCAALPQAR